MPRRISNNIPENQKNILSTLVLPPISLKKLHSSKSLLTVNADTSALFYSSSCLV